jgi:tetrapyrrole methylase family protein/MazG family protein
MMGSVRDMLMRAYPADHVLELITGEHREEIPLSQFADGTSLTSETCVWVPPLPGAASLGGLQDIVAHLRSPEGCPWDRELTWAKLRASLLEETYELLAALDAEDDTKVAEELGDLLLQIGLQTQIATEKGSFRLPDVLSGIVSKLIRRHPHVFSDTRVSGTDEVLANWEAIKRAERESNGGKRSPLSGVPAGLPALAQAEAYLDRISRLRPVNVPDAPWAVLVDGPVTPEAVGDALFGFVAWARAHGIDAESVLRATNARYAAQVEAEEEN